MIRPEGMKIGHFENNEGKLNNFYMHGKEVMKSHLNPLRDFMMS